MADRPIIFSAPMVRAMLDGRKTQTRRLMKPQPPEGTKFVTMASNGAGWAAFEEHGIGYSLHVPYAPGDRLWVKEAWRASKDYDAYPPREMSHWPVHYEADAAPDPRDELGMNGRYRHARFMPRWASRLTLIVTNVRVQRLQDISGADCIAEGVECKTCAASWTVGRSACNQRGCFEIRRNFQTLWNSLHGPDAWDANPWVVALTFTVQRGNIDQIGGAQ